MKSQLLLFLLGLLGFSACTIADAYGSPPTTFDPRLRLKVSGQVTTEDGAPITGIKISQPNSEDYTLTNTEGNYFYETARTDYRHFTLVFTDPDGEENGGDFLSREVKDVFAETDKTEEGNGKNHGGIYRKELDLTLQRNVPPDNNP